MLCNKDERLIFPFINAYLTKHFTVLENCLHLDLGGFNGGLTPKTYELQTYQKRTQVHDVPTDGEEDLEEGYKEPKDRNLKIADWLHLGVNELPEGSGNDRTEAEVNQV